MTKDELISLIETLPIKMEPYNEWGEPNGSGKKVPYYQKYKRTIDLDQLIRLIENGK